MTTLIRLTQRTPQNEARPEIFLPCEGVAEISSLIDQQHDEASTVVAYVDGRRYLVRESPDEVATFMRKATDHADPLTHYRATLTSEIMQWTRDMTAFGVSDSVLADRAERIERNCRILAHG